MNSVFNRRHHDDEIVDDISITPVSRYKTSGLSGDEWRVAYRVVLKRKGIVLFSRHYNRLENALNHLPWVMQAMFEGGVDGFNEKAWTHHVDGEELKLCHQVGCELPSTVFYRLKKIYASNGDGPLPNEGSFDYLVSFCQRHSERGNCGREDADNNYELLEGVVDAPPASDVRPSQTVGPVDLASIVDPDELRAAVGKVRERVAKKIRAKRKTGAKKRRGGKKR